SRFDTLFFDPFSSRVRFELANGIEGRFTELSGYVLLDSEMDTVASLRLVLDATSAVPTGSNQEGVDLLGPRRLDAERYPEVIYEATRIRGDTTAGSNVSIIEGALTLWGKTQALPLPASVRITGRTVAINASFDVSPVAWDSTGAHDTSPVSVRAQLVARPRDVPAPGASLRANQRYQDSLARTTPLLSDSTSRD
ncbi:MAG TPA: YceI family protein, partial [Rhodothermales bacterium]|nr:YceI family protein [Rhodothermales bacterium]